MSELRAWWEAGAWVDPSVRRRRQGPVPPSREGILDVATLLAAALALSLASQICVQLFSAEQGKQLTTSSLQLLQTTHGWRGRLMAATRGFYPIHGVLLLGAAVLLAAVRPVALGPARQRVCNTVRAVTGILAVTGIVLAVAAVADLPSLGGAYGPVETYYGGTAPLVLDRSAIAITAFASLWLLYGEPYARHLLAGRVRRQEG